MTVTYINSSDINVFSIICKKIGHGNPMNFLDAAKILLEHGFPWRNNMQDWALRLQLFFLVSYLILLLLVAMQLIKHIRDLQAASSRPTNRNSLQIQLFRPLPYPTEQSQVQQWRASLRRKTCRADRRMDGDSCSDDQLFSE